MDKAHTVKRIVCLANSRKPGGSCIAGKELLPDGTTGSWIRPISNRPSQAVSDNELRYVDGSRPHVMDIIEVPVISKKPKEYQKENWLLDPDRSWNKVGEVTTGALSQLLVDQVNSLWVNGNSTGNGINDQIPHSLAASICNSLYLIRVSYVELHVYAPGATFGKHKRRVQGHFNYNGEAYKLWLTDHIYERLYLEKVNGQYHLGQCYLTVSLGDVYQGYAYKLIAGVIEP